MTADYCLLNWIVVTSIRGFYKSRKQRGQALCLPSLSRH